MPALRRVADIADTIEDDTASTLPGVIRSCNTTENYIFLLAGLGNSEPAVCLRGHLVMNHIDITVTVGVVAVPTELAPLPGAVCHGIGTEIRRFDRGVMLHPSPAVLEGLIMLVPEMAARGPCFSGFYEPRARVVPQRVFHGVVLRGNMAARALVAAIVIVALKAHSHLQVLVLDIGLHLGCPDAGVGVVPLVHADAGTAGKYSVF